MIADYTAAIVVTLIFLIWPFIDMVACGLRYVFLRDVVNNAAHMAANCPTFQLGPDSIMSRIPGYVDAEAAKYSGISDLRTMVRVKEAGLNGQQRDGNFNQRWQALPDPQANVYTIEVVVSANLMPFLPYNGPFGNPIPGVTGPMPITIAAQLMSEFPEGLNR